MSSCSGPELTEDHLECLAEMVNIAFGQAAVPLSQLVGRFVELRLPRVELVELASVPGRLSQELSDARLHVVQQVFRPELRGEALMIFRVSEGTSISVLLGLEAGAASDEREATVELGNLLIGACLGKLGQLLGTQVSYSPPMLRAVDGSLADVPFLDDCAGQAVLIRTGFGIEDHDMDGYLLLLLTASAIEWLAQVLERELQGL